MSSYMDMLQEHNSRCIEGHIWQHVPKPDDPEYSVDLGICHECRGQGCENEACLSIDEKKQQAGRCSCRGSDDYCPCQNTPDRITKATRKSET